jgi:hypothetical protein
MRKSREVRSHFLGSLKVWFLFTPSILSCHRSIASRIHVCSMAYSLLMLDKDGLQEPQSVFCSKMLTWRRSHQNFRSSWRLSPPPLQHRNVKTENLYLRSSDYNLEQGVLSTMDLLPLKGSAGDKWSRDIKDRQRYVQILNSFFSPSPRVQRPRSYLAPDICYSGCYMRSCLFFKT